jgi:serine/threonine protein kinase
MKLRLRERLGSGGSADVYRARDERVGRDVAVKLIAEWLAGDEAALRRFQREAELAARLAHPNIPAILDVGTHPRPYIVMELVDGLNVATLLNQRQRLAVDVVVELCDALEHVHDHGVVHCDVAPRNVLIGERDGTAHLIDFGLAVDRYGASRGEIMGTPGYVAPEIVAGGAPSPESDVYSLGVVACRLLEDMPPSVTAIVESTLSPLPAARPSIAELRDRLLDARAGEIALRAA